MQSIQLEDQKCLSKKHKIGSYIVLLTACICYKFTITLHYVHWLEQRSLQNIFSFSIGQKEANCHLLYLFIRFWTVRGNNSKNRLLWQAT